MLGSGLNVHFHEREREYRGPELRPHFLLTEFGLKGSAVGAFIGPCRVETEHLVDWEDRLASDRIEAKRMLHFLGEFFGSGLAEGVLLQRLFMAQVLERLSLRLAASGGRFRARRDGDDIFVEPAGGGEARKLSVSIVTASAVSRLLHVGLNIDPSGAPVPAVGLAELGVEPAAFAKELLETLRGEWEGIQWACAKVRPV